MMTGRSMPQFALRHARADEQRTIIRLVRAAHLNPIGLDWHNFVVAADAEDSILGCGQIKTHRGGAKELASIWVLPTCRGHGVARAIIESLLSDQASRTWLTCASALVPFYSRFGFREPDARDGGPLYFRFARLVAALFRRLLPGRQYLAVMVRDP